MLIVSMIKDKVSIGTEQQCIELGFDGGEPLVLFLKQLLRVVRLRLGRCQPTPWAKARCSARTHHVQDHRRDHQRVDESEGPAEAQEIEEAVVAGGEHHQAGLGKAWTTALQESGYKSDT